jgi:hypothetical protein
VTDSTPGAPIRCAGKAHLYTVARKKGISSDCVCLDLSSECGGRFSAPFKVQDFTPLPLFLARLKEKTSFLVGDVRAQSRKMTWMHE